MKSSIEDIMIKSASERIEKRATEIVKVANEELMKEIHYNKKI